MANIMDGLIASGKAAPMIVVMPGGSGGGFRGNVSLYSVYNGVFKDANAFNQKMKLIYISIGLKRGKTRSEPMRYWENRVLKTWCFTNLWELHMNGLHGAGVLTTLLRGYLRNSMLLSSIIMLQKTFPGVNKIFGANILVEFSKPLIILKTLQMKLS